MLIKNFSDVREQLASHFVEYLESRGVETAKNFSCLDPAHEDKNPSCSLLPDHSGAYCHSCSRHFDIFDAVSLLEKKQITGMSFVIDIVQYLCTKYNVLIEMGEVSEEKTFELMVYKAYRDISEYISFDNQSAPNELVKAEIKRRGWGSKVLAETNCGVVNNYKDFIANLHNKGYDDTFIHEADLDRSDIFNENNLIFTTCDEHGNPVGFAARNLKWEKGSSLDKYVNQRTSGIKANIYQKSKRLYGFNLARHSDKPIYIFEGQGDVITARQAGLDNCCAIGSTALSTDHIMLLKEYNKYNIILCLDGDKAGLQKTIKLLDTRFAGHKDMRVQIVFLPDGMDPDEFIRTYDIEEFHKLAKRSAFEWRLQLFTDVSDPVEVCTSMIPYIINESSYLLQEDMCKALSSLTGYSHKTIMHEVERLQNAHEERKSTERINIIEKTLKEVREHPEDAEVLLTEAKNRLFNLAKQNDDDAMSEEEFLKEVVHQRSSEEAKSDKFSGFKLSTDLQFFQEALSGEWDRDVLLVVGGKENTGKSAFCCKLAIDIANHEENNAIVLFHTIDDARNQILPRFVTISEGSKQLTLNAVKDPNYWAKQNPDFLTRRQVGYGQLESLIKEGRLVVKDSNHGTSIAYVETLVQYYRERYPHRRLVYFLDNFHKLADYADQKDERVRFKKLSNAVKGIATNYHIPIICTMEYTKLPKGQRPTNHNIAESVAMSYDSNLIIHLYNDLHELGPDSEIFHTIVDATGNIRRLPRVEMIFGKNKITSFKDSLYFNFFPASSDFTGIDADVIAAQIQKSKQDKDGKMNKEHKVSDVSQLYGG
jgi:DNA primase catalytic core